MRSICTIILLFLGSALFSQEVVTGLQSDPVIRQQYSLDKQSTLKLAVDTFPISLPFFDDFSKGIVFPSSLRWIDHYAYVNTDYPVYPIDYGVVTLDAINDTGSMYPNAVGGPQPFIADHLTSRYIRLDSIFTPVPRALHPSDSVYLSFYFQPQGRGLAPETADSLVLQFLLRPGYDTIYPTDSAPTHIPEKWAHIWSVKGEALDTFYMENNVYFKRVMIPITDARFFKDSFRFQFYNYVTLASSGQPSWQSNSNQWNLDNIYLNDGRSFSDTIHREIRFTDRSPSMLLKYQAMPYTQYSNDPSNEMADTLLIILSNRDTVSHQVKYSYDVVQTGGSFAKNYQSPTFNILPYTQYAFGYLSHPPVNFTFPISSADSSEFTITHVIRDINTSSGYADTITGIQRFYNYYAYDDGTPEAGYGLKGTGAEMAYKFNLTKSPDTLRGIRVWFNHTLGRNNLQFFYLTVWDDNSGLPGDTLYSRLVLPYYSDSLNKMLTFRLEKPVKISGTFYIGTIQTTDDNLNIGLDTYNNSASNLFYNVLGDWVQSSISGSLLFRPLIGKPLPLGINALDPVTDAFRIFPNPCNTGKVNLSISEGNKARSGEGWTISISSLTGQVMLRSEWKDVIDVSVLPSGLYFVEAQNAKTMRHLISKLIIMN